ncbi:hypothetical protein AX15_003479 [Amanita polypyramis BW_CC]|nr:hypothetical protein AX15_003479 [Amanita polypyramis BW_CC]
MSLKAELGTWAAALEAYDEGDFKKALDLFSGIADSSKILTNMGLIYATVGEHESAIEKFKEAIDLDQYLAVAYFQCGVSHFLLENFDAAFDNFDGAQLYLRGNQDINYEQLGLDFKLYAAEVLFNKGLCQVYLGQEREGLRLMAEAGTLRGREDHNVIDEAIHDRGNGYTVFSIPIGILYRPSAKKLKNAVTKDYMGKAKLVASSDPTDVYTEFTGVARLKQGISPSGIYVDRPDIDPPVVVRSATVPSLKLPLVRDSDTVPQTAAGLGRSTTTINVPSNYRDRITGKTDVSSASPIPTVPAAPSVDHSSRLSDRSKGIGSLSRGPSSKRPPPTTLDLPLVLEDTTASNRDKRLTDFYDDYLDSYGEAASAMLPSVHHNPRVAPAYNPPSRKGGLQREQSIDHVSGMRSAPVGGSLRKSTKRSVRRPEYEDEGCDTREYEEIPYDMQRMRIKIHYNGEIRGMALPTDTTFAEFMDKLTSKFGRSITGLGIKFKDEDGGKVSLRDESDFELAVETAREGANGKGEGRLEIWCTDL